MKTISPGMEVGGRRIPFHGSHHDCWGAPWKGVVLRNNDVQAWTGTIAFRGTPTQAAVDKHLAYCVEHDLLDGMAPVLWSFADEQKVYWETLQNLRPYEECLAEFYVRRAQAKASSMAQTHQVVSVG